jgi:hypothetical protein
VTENAGPQGGRSPFSMCDAQSRPGETTSSLAIGHVGETQKVKMAEADPITVSSDASTATST